MISASSSFLFRKKIYLYFLLFFNFLSFAQPVEHQQIENQIDKCFDILANGDPDQAFLCLEKQKAVLEKTGYIKSVTVYYYTAISNIYLMKGEHQNALNIITEGYQKYKDKLSEEDKNRFDVLELTVLESQNKHREVLARIDEILPKTKDKKHQAILYAMKASSLNMMGEYEKAASYYH